MTLRRGGFVLGMAFGVALVVTCGGTAGNSPGGMNGTSGGDGSTFGGDGSMFDIAGADAQPPGGPGPAQTMVMDGVCDKTVSRQYTTNGTTYVTNYYFAEFPLGLAPKDAPHLSAVACTIQGYGGTTWSWYALGPCPNGVTCQDGAYTPPAADCQMSSARVSDNGAVLVFCGYRTTLTGNSNSDSGYKAATAHLRVN